MSDTALENLRAIDLWRLDACVPTAAVFVRRAIELLVADHVDPLISKPVPLLYFGTLEGHAQLTDRNGEFD